jgi:hypoxanthine phosphoribosyltransferase
MGEKVYPLIPEKELKKRVEELAQIISRDYKNKELNLILILKGAFVFGADLIRFLKIPVRVHFLRAKSYQKKKSTGKVKINFLDGKEIKGKEVLIVEDILDTALTLKETISFLKEFQPKEIKICALLDKMVLKKEKIKADYLGFKIENKFVVGYGIDFDEKFRNLPYIGYIKG